MWPRSRAALAALVLALAAGCGGSSGGTGSPACTETCATPTNVLTAADIQRIVAQAVGEAQARGVRAHVAVVDRVGNVLAVFSMTGAPATVSISSGLAVSGGLDGIPQGVVPAPLAAISKAVTGAFLSSQGNAFSTRTASQIVQEHFNPNEAHQPSGPLYGVQFSQLSCSDVNRNMSHGSVGPKRSPLGLAADPGGLPIYKNGVLAGGIGIEANGRYGIDRDITDIDQDDEEIVAVAGTAGFSAPADIRADRITADGRTFRFVDSEALRSNPAQPSAFGSLAGALVAVPGYSSAAIVPGSAFGTPASGIRPDTGPFAAAGGWVLVDAADSNRHPARDGGPGSLIASEVQAVLLQSLDIARRARAQIRRPLGSAAEVTISIVDLQGNIIGLVRTPDAPVFGIDVAVQKARTALFFSQGDALARLQALLPAQYAVPGTVPFRSLADYGGDLAGFAGAGSLGGGVAWSSRAIGNVHRPYFPDGLENSPRGPLSTPIAQWSPFNLGFQLDLIYNRLVEGVLGDTSPGCAAPPLRNGAQIFPGGIPIYRAGALAGAIGVSGDGVDQDDMVAYLALENVARAGGFVANAPRERRADTLTPLGVRLRYVQCPQSPFIGSTEQNVCG